MIAEPAITVVGDANPDEAPDCTVTVSDGVPVPDTWTAYRADLRICLAADVVCALPARPAFPAGT